MSDQQPANNTHTGGNEPLTYGAQSASTSVETAANDLIKAMADQFKLSAQVSAIEMNTAAAVNVSTQAFYSALRERLITLFTSSQQARRHANSVRGFADDMTALLQKARRLEALVDRLDEYTVRQEAALSKRTNVSTE